MEMEMGMEMDMKCVSIWRIVMALEIAKCDGNDSNGNVKWCEDVYERHEQVDALEFGEYLAKSYVRNAA